MAGVLLRLCRVTGWVGPLHRYSATHPRLVKSPDLEPAQMSRRILRLGLDVHRDDARLLDEISQHMRAVTIG
jgi:hypothetical protein